jgi:hypothetical protein
MFHRMRQSIACGLLPSTRLFLFGVSSPRTCRLKLLAGHRAWDLDCSSLTSLPNPKLVLIEVREGKWYEDIHSLTRARYLQVAAGSRVYQRSMPLLSEGASAVTVWPRRVRSAPPARTPPCVSALPEAGKLPGRENGPPPRLAGLESLSPRSTLQTL